MRRHARAIRSTCAAVPARATPSRVCSFLGVATRVTARTFEYETLPRRMASLSFGNSPRARATRTCSRAAPGESPARQLSQCAHVRQPSQPSRSSNSRMRTSSSWVAAWMRADSAAMRSPSRASCAPRSLGAVVGSRGGGSSGGSRGGGGCVRDVDGAGLFSASMNHCNPLYFNDLRRPCTVDRRSDRGLSLLGARTRGLRPERRSKGRSWRHARLAPTRPDEAVKRKMRAGKKMRPPASRGKRQGLSSSRIVVTHANESRTPVSVAAWADIAPALFQESRQDPARLLARQRAAARVDERRRPRSALPAAVAGPELGGVRR